MDGATPAPSLMADAIQDAISGKPVVVPPSHPDVPPTPVAGPSATPAPAAKPTLSVPDSLLSGGKPEPPATPPKPADPPAPGNKDENLANMRKRIEDQQRLIDELNATKARFLGDDGKFKVPPELDQTIKTKDEEISRLSDELARVNFTKSPQFLQKYQAPLDQTFGRVLAVVKEFGGDEAMANQLALGTMRQRADIIKQHLPDAAPFLSPMLTRIDELLTARNQAVEDHKTVAGKLKEEETIQTQERVTALRSAMRDKVLASLEEEGHFVFRKVPGNDAWNARVDQFRDAVNTIINSNDIELQTEALALSVTAPVYRQLFEEERQARIALERRLGQTRVATVTPGGGGSTSGGSSEGGPAQFSPEAAANAVMSKLFQSS